MVGYPTRFGNAYRHIESEKDSSKSSLETSDNRNYYQIPHNNFKTARGKNERPRE
jgi:hypothetical protein